MKKIIFMNEKINNLLHKKSFFFVNDDDATCTTPTYMYVNPTC